MGAVSSAPDTARLIPSDYRLRIPGPTMVPERVRQATALPGFPTVAPSFAGCSATRRICCEA